MSNNNKMRETETLTLSGTLSGPNTNSFRPTDQRMNQPAPPQHYQQVVSNYANQNLLGAAHDRHYQPGPTHEQRSARMPPDEAKGHALALQGTTYSRSSDTQSQNINDDGELSQTSNEDGEQMLK